MRIEKVSSENSIKSPSVSKKDGILSLKQGDSFKGKVLFSNGDVANIKLADGAVIKARIEGNPDLQEGAERQLVVLENAEGTVTLSIVSDEGPQKEALPADVVSLAGGDRELEAMASALKRLNLPLNRQTLGKMAEIMKNNPTMSLEDAAFIASNKGLSQTKEAVTATALALSDLKTAGQMLKAVFSALTFFPEGGETSAPPQLGGESLQEGDIPPAAQTGEQSEAAAASSPQAAVQGGETVKEAPFSALNLPDLPELSRPEGELPRVAAEVPHLAAEAPGGDTPATIAGQSAPPAAPQTDGGEALSTRGAPIWIELVGEILSSAAESPPTAQGEVQTSVAAMQNHEGGVATAIDGNRAETALNIEQNSILQGEQTPTPVDLISKGVEQASTAPPVPPQGELATGAAAPALPKAEGETLAGNEVQGEKGAVPQRAALDSPPPVRAEEMAGRLEVAAKEVAAILASPQSEQPAKMADFIGRMFAQIDDLSKNTPKEIERAKEELLLKANLIKEAALRSPALEKGGVVQEAEKLVNHVKLLGQIDQYSYVQIPIFQGGEQKTAELFIYQNKKKTAKIDPENVRILLALESAHMGYISAFVTIKQKDISLKMGVEKQDYADFFRSKTVDLHHSLAESGYRLIENRVELQKEKVSPQMAMAALKDAEIKPMGFDIRL